MRYLYRCATCGREEERQQSMTQAVPEFLEEPGTMLHTTSSGAYCQGDIRRVYNFPGMALGPLNAKYSNNEGYIDQNKFYGADWAKKHNHLH